MAYTFTTITFPNDTFTQALGINSTDTIVGFHGATTNLAYSLVLPATFTPVTTPANLMRKFRRLQYRWSLPRPTQ